MMAVTMMMVIVAMVTSPSSRGVASGSAPPKWSPPPTSIELIKIKFAMIVIIIAILNIIAIESIIAIVLISIMLTFRSHWSSWTWHRWWHRSPPSEPEAAQHQKKASSLEEHSSYLPPWFWQEMGQGWYVLLHWDIFTVREWLISSYKSHYDDFAMDSDDAHMRVRHIEHLSSSDKIPVDVSLWSHFSLLVHLPLLLWSIVFLWSVLVSF